jgi:hypothetical protein
MRAAGLLGLLGMRPPSTSLLPSTQHAARSTRVYLPLLPSPSPWRTADHSSLCPPNLPRAAPTPLRRCLVQRFKPILSSLSRPPEHPFFFVPGPSPSGGYR